MWPGGGELAAAVLTDTIGRLIPGVLNDESSALSDSFQDNLLAPLFIPARTFQRLGRATCSYERQHRLIVDEWRHEQSILRTKEKADLMDE